MIELFPTYESIKNYSLKNLKLVFQFENNLDACFIKNNSDYKTSFQNIFEQEPIWFEWKEYHFPVFIHQNEKELYTKNGEISFDIYLNIFLFLSGWQEHISDKKDLHGRFPFDASLQHKHKFVKIPVVNIYYELLFEVAQKTGLNISKTKFENPFILSHDIDQFRSAWFENIQYEQSHFSLKSIFKIPLNIVKRLLGFKDDYYKGMERMLKIDSENNIDAITFLLAKKSHQDADFDITNKEFFKIISKTVKEQEIGIHPGYYTFDNEQEYQNQKNLIEEISKKKITKSRQHFLRYDIKKTPFIQEKLQIEEDYTLGFAEQYGFRNGIANSFYLFNFQEQKAFKLIQVPLVFMDVSLTNYSLETEFEEVISFLSKTKTDFNCNFSILFHNSVFSDEKYKGFEDLYLKILELLK